MRRADGGRSHHTRHLLVRLADGRLVADSLVPLSPIPDLNSEMRAHGCHVRSRYNLQGSPFGARVHYTLRLPCTT